MSFMGFYGMEKDMLNYVGLFFFCRGVLGVEEFELGLLSRFEFN